MKSPIETAQEMLRKRAETGRDFDAPTLAAMTAEARAEERERWKRKIVFRYRCEPCATEWHAGDLLGLCQESLERGHGVKSGAAGNASCPQCDNTNLEPVCREMVETMDYAAIARARAEGFNEGVDKCLRVFPVPDSRNEWEKGYAVLFEGLKKPVPR